MCLRDIIDAALVYVRILVDYGYGVIYRIIVQLRLVIKQVQLKLRGLLDRARQLIGKPMRTPLERVECRVQLFHWQAEVMGYC